MVDWTQRERTDRNREGSATVDDMTAQEWEEFERAMDAAELAADEAGGDHGEYSSACFFEQV